MIFLDLIFRQQEKDEAILEILQKYGENQRSAWIFFTEKCGHFETKTMPAELERDLKTKNRQNYSLEWLHKLMNLVSEISIVMIFLSRIIKARLPLDASSIVKL